MTVSAEDVRIENRASAPVFVKLRGEVNFYTAPRAHKFLQELFQKGYSNLCVDLDDLSFEDDVAFNLLTSALQDLGNEREHLCIVCTDWRHQTILRLTGLEKVFRIFGDPMDALWYLEKKYPKEEKTTRFAVTWCDLSA